MKKRILALLLVAAASCTLVAGCGKDTPADATEADTQGAVLELSTQNTVSEDFYIEEDTEEDTEVVSRTPMYAADGTDVYSKPDENSKTVETLEKGDAVTAVGDATEGWQNVETASDKNGYVKSDKLQTPEQYSAAQQEEEKAKEEAARKEREEAYAKEQAEKAQQQEPAASTPDVVNPSTWTDTLTEEEKQEIGQNSAEGSWSVNEDGNQSFTITYHYGPFTSRMEKDESYTIEEQNFVDDAEIMYIRGGYTEEALATAKEAYPQVIFEFRSESAEYANELDYAGAYYTYNPTAGCYVYYNKYQ